MGWKRHVGMSLVAIIALCIYSAAFAWVVLSSSVAMANWILQNLQFVMSLHVDLPIAGIAKFFFFNSLNNARSKYPSPYQCY